MAGNRVPQYLWYHTVRTYHSYNKLRLASLLRTPCQIWATLYKQHTVKCSILEFIPGNCFASRAANIIQSEKLMGLVMHTFWEYTCRRKHKTNQSIETSKHHQLIFQNLRVRLLKLLPRKRKQIFCIPSLSVVNGPPFAFRGLKNVLCIFESSYIFDRQVYNFFCRCSVFVIVILHPCHIVSHPFRVNLHYCVIIYTTRRQIWPASPRHHSIMSFVSNACSTWIQSNFQISLKFRTVIDSSRYNTVQLRLYQSEQNFWMKSVPEHTQAEVHWKDNSSKIGSNNNFGRQWILQIGILS